MKIQSLYSNHKNQVKFFFFFFFLVHKTSLELYSIVAFSKIRQGLVLKRGRTTG